MTLKKTELYETWNQHWHDHSKMTPVGRIMSPRRIAAMEAAISGLRVETAIDAGCGTGNLLVVFHKLGFDYTGIDVSPEAVEICSKRGLKARLGRLEDEPGAYDLVASEGMLEHFINFVPFAEHMMRISKRYVLLMQPNHDSFAGRTLVYLARTIRGDRIVFEYNYRIGDFVKAFEDRGFMTVINQPVILDTSRLLLFERRA